MPRSLLLPIHFASFTNFRNVKSQRDQAKLLMRRQIGLYVFNIQAIVCCGQKYVRCQKHEFGSGVSFLIHKQQLHISVKFLAIECLAGRVLKLNFPVQFLDLSSIHFKRRSTLHNSKFNIIYVKKPAIFQISVIAAWHLQVS